LGPGGEKVLLKREFEELKKVKNLKVKNVARILKYFRS